MFQDLAALKPWLTAFALPPLNLFLLLLLGFLVLLKSQSRSLKNLGNFILGLSAVLLYWTGCIVSAVWLEHEFLLPAQTSSKHPSDALAITALEPGIVKTQFTAQKIQAIVVLGGGVHAMNPEYGQAALSEASMQRLHYAAFLSRQTGIPLAFSGGIGWLAGQREGSEAQAAQHWLAQLGLPSLTWSEAQSRDTASNAVQIAAVLKAHKVERIALVTHAMHMRRALRAFENTGLSVLPAPIDFTQSESTQGLDWLPSGRGLHRTRQVLHEIVGLKLAS